MKVLLDTNVLVAAFISHGSCHELVEHCFNEHQIVTSGGLVHEFLETLTTKLGFAKSDVREAKRVLLRMATLVEVNALESPVCRDPDDDEVLATAKSAGAACIITGDKDLLVLRRHGAVRTVSPDQFWSLDQT